MDRGQSVLRGVWDSSGAALGRSFHSALVCGFFQDWSFQTECLLTLLIVLLLQLSTEVAPSGSNRLLLSLVLFVQRPLQLELIHPAALCLCLELLVLLLEAAISTSVHS